MAQPAGYSKTALNIYPFWEKMSVEPLLEWSKWAAILEMAVFTKNGIEVRNLLRARPSLVKPSELIYEVEITAKQGHRRKTGRFRIRRNELVGRIML